MLPKLRKRFKKGSFLRSVAVLMSGTAAAQALIVLSLPLLTRVYSPEDFAVLAVYVAALSILTISACLRLEIAIPLPDDDVDAASLLALALSSSVVVTAAVAIPVLAFPQSIPTMMSDLDEFAWLLPIGVWFASSYSALQYWSTRKRRFGDIARTRLAQAAGGTSTQVGLGVLGHAPLGLLLGHLVIGGAGVVGLAREAVRHDWAAISQVRLASMRDAFVAYQRFPKYSTFDAVINTAGLQLPVLIIAFYAIGPEAGLLMLATRTMQAPMALMGTSVGQVFLSEAPTRHRGGTLADFTAEIMANLAKIGTGPILFAAIVAPVAFPYIFGAAWKDAGFMVSWMAPWFVLQFISSPVSMVMHVLQRQREMLALTVFGLVTRVGLVLTAAVYWPHGMVESFAIGSALFYLVLAIVVLKRAGCHRGHAWLIVRRGLETAVPGVLLGLILLIAYRHLEG